MNRIALTNRIFLALLGTLFLTGCDRQATPTAKSQAFEHTLNVHVNAIKTGNLTDLIPTVGENVAMISPAGSKIDSKEAFVKFHENWFNLKNWEWDGKILRTESSDSLGYALIQYKFTQKDSVGKVQFQGDSYLVLIFKNSAQGWVLVHDQNTSIKP